MHKLYSKIILFKELIQCHIAGLSWYHYLKLITRKNKIQKVKFQNKNVVFSHWFWFIHGIQELFVDKTYYFLSRNDNPLIIDCGANIGLSIIYFKQLYPNSTVICFEPDREIYNLLIENLNSFQLEDIQIENAAVWKLDGFINFNSDGQVGGKIDDTKKGELTKSIRLKSLLNKSIDFLKIDIEGAEYEVLKDCEDNLHYVENIFIEYHSSPKEPQKLQEILTILQNAGFRYYMKEAWPNRIHPFIEKNSASSVYDLQLNIFGYRINEPS